MMALKLIQVQRSVKEKMEQSELEEECGKRGNYTLTKDIDGVLLLDLREPKVSRGSI